MKKQKLIRLLREMLRNSKRSDRELAKILGVSQPTVSRTRARIEKEYIKTYTVIPDFEKLGYQILAFTFTKLKAYPSSEEVEKIAQHATEWTNEHPNVIFAADGEGLEKDLIMISFHKDYAQYSDFMRNYAMYWGQIVNNFNSFLVSLGSGFKLKPLDLKYLADDL
jgi:DNA-binding Lrp family transcriptional regulator